MSRAAARAAAVGLGLAGLVLGPACARLGLARPALLVSDGRPCMGTVLEITLLVESPAQGRALLAELFALADEIETLASRHAPASQLSQLNAAAGRGPLRVDPRLARMLAEARGYAAKTQGSFDVGVGPLVDLWSEAEQRGTAPDPDALAQARARVGASRIRVEGDLVELEPGMRLDLGGFAKGWTLDRMRERLEAAGVRDAFLDFGQSSVLALGVPPDAPAWTLALRDGRGGVAGLVELRDASLSVSGSLGQSSEIGGVRYGHIVDPRSGMALTRNVQAAVVAESGAEAEAWSKALVVLGAAALPLVERERGVEALLLDEDGRELPSSGWVQETHFQPIP